MAKIAYLEGHPDENISLRDTHEMMKNGRDNRDDNSQIQELERIDLGDIDLDEEAER